MKKVLIIFTVSLLLSNWIAGHAKDMAHEQIDAGLKEIWYSMIARLIAKDIDGAVSFFTYQTQKRYRDQFSLMRDNLPAIFSEISEIEAVYIKEDEAKYRTHMRGEADRHTSYIWFRKDVWGQWKIEKF